MRKNLLEFLFGPAAVSATSQTLGEDVVRLFEEAESEESAECAVNKKPLTTALKAIGISNEVVSGTQCCEIHCADAQEFRKHLALLADADNMFKLAELGWVAAVNGDVAMSGEPADYKIGFIELNMLENGENTADVKDLEKVLKDAQKFAATEPDRDDDMNPVENDDKTSDDNQKGVAKAKDGSQPEGTPKGAKVVKEAIDPLLVGAATGVAAGTAISGGLAWLEKRKARKQAEATKHAADAKQVKCDASGNCAPSQTSAPRTEAKSSKAAQELAAKMLDEMTTCAGVPAVDGPPLGTVSSVPNRGKDRLRKLKQRRDPENYESRRPNR